MTKKIQVGTVVPYTIDDVASVTLETVDPIPAAVDDEYTAYTITLDDGTTHTVQVYGMATREMNDNSLYRTGYSGDTDDIFSYGN